MKAIPVQSQQDAIGPFLPGPADQTANLVEVKNSKETVVAISSQGKPMKAILTLLILSSVGFAVAQEPTPEPEFAITITVAGPDGKTAFSQSAILPASLMVQLVAACEIEAAKQNIGTPNAAYDASKPISDTNQPVLPVKGPLAVASFIKWFLGAVTEANAGTMEAQQLAAEKKKVVTEKIQKVKIRDNKAPATVTPTR